MKNKIVTQYDGVFTQAVDVMAGLRRYGSAIGMVHITENIVRAAVERAETAVREYDEAGAAKEALVAAQKAVDQLGQKFIQGTRHVLAVHFGEEFSGAWIPTGFPNQSLAIPTTMGARQALLRALQLFFESHPEYENPLLNITAAQAGICFTELSDARDVVNNAYTQLAAAKEARDVAMEYLRKKLRGCIAELELLIEDTDSRWYSFGFTPPAAPETPEPVEDLQLSNAGPAKVLASWTGAPRADRYRVLKQIVGVDAEPVPVETVYDTRFAFTDLTAGQLLRVQVVPVNDAGPGSPSEMVEIMVT